MTIRPRCSPSSSRRSTSSPPASASPSEIVGSAAGSTTAPSNASSVPSRRRPSSPSADHIGRVLVPALADREQRVLGRRPADADLLPEHRPHRHEQSTIERAVLSTGGQVLLRRQRLLDRCITTVVITYPTPILLDHVRRMRSTSTRSPGATYWASAGAEAVVALVVLKLDEPEVRSSSTRPRQTSSGVVDVLLGARYSCIVGRPGRGAQVPRVVRLGPRAESRCRLMSPIVVPLDRRGASGRQGGVARWLARVRAAASAPRRATSSDAGTIS